MASKAPSLRPVVFITGASSGIGAAAVDVFAAAGYDVVLGARRKDKLENVAKAVAVTRQAVSIVPLVCDVSSDESVQAVFTQIKDRFGRLDVLINNAGFGAYGEGATLPLDTFRACMETNFFGVVRCTQAALPLLRKTAAANSKQRWGAAIVMVSSFVGRRALPMMSPYCASKFALEGLSESMRVELFDEKISVSVVNPGVTQTEFIDASKGERPANFLPPAQGMTSEQVARVLLQAVRRPRRNRYLTMAGRVGIFLEWLAPSILDRVLLSTWRKIRKSEHK